MKLFSGQFIRTTMLALALSAGIGGYAYANNTPVLEDNHTVSTSVDEEKLINNVKVFYNPIAEEITVNFKLSKSSNVVIKVMDALGGEVLNLHNAELDAGVQNLGFSTQQKLSEGFYFVRVSSGTETIVKRISVRA